MLKRLSLFEELDTSLSQDDIAHSNRQRIEEKFAPLMREEPRLTRLVSYVGNKTMPVLRLHSYKEALPFALLKNSLDALD